MKDYYFIIILMILTFLQIIGQIGYYQNVSKNEVLREKINPKRYIRFLVFFVVLFVAEIVFFVFRNVHDELLLFGSSGLKEQCMRH